jgi:hypothetical protein
MYPQSFQNIAKDSDKDFLLSLGSAISERDSRMTRKSNVEVYDYEPSDIHAEVHLAWSGSIGLMVAPKGSEILDRVRKCVTSKSKDDIDLANELKNDVVGRKPIPYDLAVKGLIEKPVFASLRYKGRVISSGIFVPDGLKAYTSGIPYNGGELDADAFELVEHLKGNTEGEELQAIILKRPPVLTDAEKYAISSLTDDELNLGTGIMCFALSAVTIAATVSAATGMTCPQSSDYKRGLKKPELDIDVLNASPEMIARSLLNTRRKIIEGIIA